MHSTALGSDAIEQLALAVFSKPGGRVMEAYSAFEKQPREFRTAVDLAYYIRSTLSQPQSLVDVVIHYPDMGGPPVIERIEIDQKVVPRNSHRYAWRGWGLIHLQLSDEGGPRSRVSSFSPGKATQWSETIPSFGSVEHWDWEAVRRHTRRLQRVLKMVA